MKPQYKGDLSSWLLKHADETLGLKVPLNDFDNQLGAAFGA
jgi:hypothetical protein